MNGGGKFLKGFMIFVINLLNINMQCKIFHGGKYKDIGSYQVIIPERIDENGLFLPYPALYRKQEFADGTVQFYKIPVEDEHMILQLNKNSDLISSNAVVEKIDRKRLKLKNSRCYCSGHVKGDNFSKVAISTCNGLAGFIRSKRGDFVIEPVEGHNRFQERLHVLYKPEYKGKGKTSCKTVKRENNEDMNNDTQVPSALHIEILIVVDKSFCSYYQESSWENFVLTIFNMAFVLLHDASLDFLIFLSIVRIVQMDVSEKEINVKKGQDVKKILENFQEWQYKINTGDDSHPNHHDVAVLLTKSNLCSDNSTCGLLGLTTLAAACDGKKSAIVTFENGLRTGFVLAHQIAHILGAEHDDSATGKCNGTIPNGMQTVMHPYVDTFAGKWSKCTRAYIRAFMELGYGKCLLDKPFEHKFNTQDLLPGVMYNADFQCRHTVAPKARECETGSTCDSLKCYVPGVGCVKTKVPPAAGTRCGENMWCFAGKCIMVGERPSAVDGNWGTWSRWSDCSRTCGSGISSSERRCDHPGPSNGGKYCLGPRKRYRICAALPCPPGTSFRDIQCGEFNDWIFPEDGKKHVWKEYYYHNENPCKLFCINDKNEIAALRPRVLDGTECYRGIRDVCIEGTCKTIPCNLEFDSKAIEDICGVCRGDGTTCELVTGTQFFVKGSKTKLLSIPAGTRNINVEELTPTSALIVVKDKETKAVYLDGTKLGMLGVPGSQAWLGMIRNRQESLRIPGPVTKPINIWINRLENVTVRWSMALPLDQMRKPEFAWDFVKWEPCSTYCGPGIQISYPSCIEQKAGLVEDNYCSDLDPPPPRTRPCEVTKCVPRWMVSNWQECKGKNSSATKRKRKVKCVKSFGEGQGIEKIIPDSKCPAPKPHEVEPCAPRKRRCLILRRKRICKKLKRHELLKNKSGVKELVHSKLRRYHLNPEESSLKAKQEEPEGFERPEIRKGVLIIDQDDISNKEIEIVLDGNEKGELVKKYLKKLPKDSNVLQLKGKKVFELLKKLQEKQ